MIHLEYTLAFTGHALFQHSTVKAGSFNEVRSLDAPQVSTIYGALTQCASMMGLDTSILEKVAVTPPELISSPIRSMLVLSAPMSPFDWQAKWVDRGGRYTYNRRVYPRKAFPLWRPRYRMQLFAEDEDAERYATKALRILASRMDDNVGANLGLGYKKKLFGSFECKTIIRRELHERTMGGSRVCEVLSDCPARFNSVVPLQPITRTLIFRNIHRGRGVPPIVHCSVYAPGSVVLLKDDTQVRWYDYVVDPANGVKKRVDALGVSGLIETRSFGGEKVKAAQGLFLTHEAEK